MPNTDIGPFKWAEISRKFSYYLYSYHYLQRSDYGYSLFVRERVYALALIYSWDDIRDRIISFENIHSFCRYAAMCKIVLPNYSYAWGDTTNDEIHSVLGYFLQQEAYLESKEYEYHDKVIVHSLMYYLDGMLALMKKILLDNEEIGSDLSIDAQGFAADLIYDPVFQELIANDTAINTASTYVEELEKRLREK